MQFILVSIDNNKLFRLKNDFNLHNGACGLHNNAKVVCFLGVYRISKKKYGKISV